MKNENKHRVDLELHHNCLMVHIDGEYVPACKRIETDNEESTENMKFIPNENVLFSKDVQVDLPQYTRFAMIVLRNELLKHGDLYDGFLASMRSAIEDAEKWHMNDWLETDYDKRKEDLDRLTECILKRIIGEE